MKEIRLRHISSKGKIHEVCLGNGTINTFNSLRDARQFIATTNNFLTDKIHDLNLIYSEVWVAYRNNWFYLDNGRKQGNADNYQLERDCEHLITTTHNLFNLSTERCGFTIGNYFVFIHLSKITDNLENIVRILSQIYGQRKDGNAIYHMDSLVRRVMYLRNEINDYGKRSTTKHFKMPTHISEDKSYIPELAVLRVA